VPGTGGDITNVSFRDASIRDSINAVSFKSLPAFVGRAHNVSFENLRLTNVKKAVTVNFFNQGDAGVGIASTGVGDPGDASVGIASTGVGVDVAGTSTVLRLATTYTDSMTITNMSGTVLLNAGHIYCAAALPCTGIVMQGIRLTSTSAGGVVGGYNCTYATGTSDDCSPTPCAWPPATRERSSLLHLGDQP
jgi:hypothetical protein